MCKLTWVSRFKPSVSDDLMTVSQAGTNQLAVLSSHPFRIRMVVMWSCFLSPLIYKEIKYNVVEFKLLTFIFLAPILCYRETMKR
jgi:hypothetical protein